MGYNSQRGIDPVLRSGSKEELAPLGDNSRTHSWRLEPPEELILTVEARKSALPGLRRASLKLHHSVRSGINGQQCPIDIVPVHGMRLTCEVEGHDWVSGDIE